MKNCTQHYLTTTSEESPACIIALTSPRMPFCPFLFFLKAFSLWLLLSVYTAVFLFKGPMTPKSMFYIMFTVTIKAAGKKRTRHLLKKVKSGGLRSAWGLQKGLLAFVLATLSYPTALSWGLYFPCASGSNVDTTAKNTCKHRSLTWRLLLLSGKHLMPPSPDAWPSPYPPELSSWSPPACPVEGKRRTQGPYSIN